jgi:hypothetical protein
MNKLTDVVGKALKAVFAAVVAFLSGLVAVLSGNTGFGDLKAGQWVSIALSTVIAFGGVYGITNKQP